MRTDRGRPAAGVAYWGVALQRRDLTKGQQAMALAMIYPEPKRGLHSEFRSRTVEVSKARLSDARAVLRHSEAMTLKTEMIRPLRGRARRCLRYTFLNVIFQRLGEVVITQGVGRCDALGGVHRLISER